MSLEDFKNNIYENEINIIRNNIENIFEKAKNEKININVISNYINKIILEDIEELRNDFQ